MNERLRVLVKDITPPILVRTARRRRSAGGSIPQSAPQLRPASYYDKVYADSTAYQGPYAESEYYFMWSIVADRLLRSGAQSVLDLGCGPGQFASLLVDRGGVVHYCGLDFSTVSIELARARCPTLEFVRIDLSDPLAFEARDYDWAVALEVLEHVDDDISLLARLKPGSRVLLTVPNFPDPAHVRTFNSADAVRERYGPLFKGVRVDALMVGTHGQMFFLFEGTRSLRSGV